ncbi:unnamed protein product [Closterium sp. NIES-53]
MFVTAWASATNRTRTLLPNARSDEPPTTRSLNYNKLSGPIPDNIGYLTSLVYLGLRSNNLSGSIPPSVSLLQNINALWVPRCPCQSITAASVPLDHCCYSTLNTQPARCSVQSQ